MNPPSLNGKILFGNVLVISGMTAEEYHSALKPSVGDTIKVNGKLVTVTAVETVRKLIDPPRYEMGVRFKENTNATT